MVGLEDWVPPFVHCGRGWVWLAWAPPVPGTALSERGELKISPALSGVGAQMRTRQATGRGARHGVGADGGEVGGLADGLVLTGALWVQSGCGAPTVGQQSLSRSHWPGCSGSPRGSWLGGWAPSSVTPRCHLQEDPVTGSGLGTLDLELRQRGTQPGQGS